MNGSKDSLGPCQLTNEPIATLHGEALQRLCRAYGVHDGFHDIWGQYHTASDELKRALLGVLLGGHGDVDEHAPGSANCIWIDNCRVTGPNERLSLELGVPAELPLALSWRVELESGQALLGVFRRQQGEHVEWQSDNADARLQPVHEEDSRHCADRHVQRWRFELDTMLSSGYHRFVLAPAHALGSDALSVDEVVCAIVVTPAHCHLAEPVPRESGNPRRLWGLSIQLYALRSSRNWGVGDFSDLRKVIERAAALGADSIGLNPLHAIRTLHPGLCSPYSPASRQFLNVLYIDVESVSEYHECAPARLLVDSAEFNDRIRALRAQDLVDYDKVAALKLQVLQLLYKQFRKDHLNTNSSRSADFRQFQRSGGRALRLHALFEALQAEMAAPGASAHAVLMVPDRVLGWPGWPRRYQSPRTSESSDFERTHLEHVEFYEYLQWCAHQQLVQIEQFAKQAGLGLGLYLDLALGNDSGGPDVWAEQDNFALGASVGAPPDDLGPAGQDWGIAVFKPNQLASTAYDAFVRVLRAQMRFAGALRIDHVMGLMRQYWIVPTEWGKQGGYVSFPFDELLGIVALESVRNRCVIVGEDLGTVPDEVRAKLAARGVLSYRVLYFEKRWSEDGGFKGTQEYPEQALAVATTHDLPTLRGFWKGTDLDARAVIGEGTGGFPDARIRERLYAERDADRYRLHALLCEHALDPGEGEYCHGGHPPPGLSAAVHRFLARTRCLLTMVQIEDVLEQDEQTNLPGTTHEHANWCRKLSLPVELWDENAALNQLAGIMAADR